MESRTDRTPQDQQVPNVRYPQLNIPVPDPSTRTAIAIEEAKAELRREIVGTQTLFEARLSSCAQQAHQELMIIDERVKGNDVRYEQRHNAAQQAIVDAFAAAAAARNKTDEAQQRHNIAQNEWRGTLNDMTASLMTRNEVRAELTAIHAKIDSFSLNINETVRKIETTITTREGKVSGSSERVNILIAIGGLVLAAVAAISIFLKPTPPTFAPIPTVIEGQLHGPHS